MDEKIRCQSCGMPLGDSHHGTNADGSFHPEYCQFCYQQGAFTNPAQTLEGMIASSVEYMSTKLNYSREDAEKLSRQIIPKLERWRESEF